MSVARVRALRSLQASLRHSGVRPTLRLSAPTRSQLIVGRRYASGGGHAHGAPSSDLPWLAGAIVITIPSCWFLWPDTSHAEHHGDHGGHGEHDESHADSKGKEESGEEKQEGDDDSSDDTSDKDEAAKEGEDTAKPSGAEGEAQPGPPDANKKSGPNDGAESKETPEDKGNVDGVSFKGKVSGEAAEDNRRSEPDSKGAYKKRIDSGLGKNLGEGTSDDQAATAKPPKEGGMSGKQAGMSNTATKHSTKVDEDPSKSKKPEGPETAKAIGTVDPNRPQV